MIDILKESAQEAGNFVLNNFHKKVSISEKYSFQDLATQVDIDCQKMIQERLLVYLSTHGITANSISFIGEENLRDSEKEHLFIIDPIDGTTNYVCGIRRFSVTIAYLHKGQLTISVIYEPYNHYLYWAERGKGAYKQDSNGVTRLRVSDLPIKKMVMLTHLSKYPEARKKVFRMTEKMYTEVLGIRMNTSTALDLANVAEGMNLFAVYGNSKVYDIAAPQLLLEESGGVLVNWQGKKFDLDFVDVEKSYMIVATHPNNITNITAITKEI